MTTTTQPIRTTPRDLCLAIWPGMPINLDVRPDGGTTYAGTQTPLRAVPLDCQIVVDADGRIDDGQGGWIADRIGRLGVRQLALLRAAMDARGVQQQAQATANASTPTQHPDRSLLVLGANCIMPQWRVGTPTSPIHWGNGQFSAEASDMQYSGRGLVALQSARTGSVEIFELPRATTNEDGDVAFWTLTCKRGFLLVIFND